MSQSFNCSACGAPVTPAPGTDTMPCPYCETSLIIPPHLRQKAVAPPPPAKKPLDPFHAAANARLDEKSQERALRETEMLSDGLRKAQPVALKAMRIYRYWALARYYLPGCITVLIIACLVTCALLVAAAFFMGQLNF